MSQLSTYLLMQVGFWGYGGFLTHDFTNFLVLSFMNSPLIFCPHLFWFNKLAHTSRTPKGWGGFFEMELPNFLVSSFKNSLFIFCFTSFLGQQTRSRELDLKGWGGFKNVIPNLLVQSFKNSLFIFYPLFQVSLLAHASWVLNNEELWGDNLTDNLPLITLTVIRGKHPISFWGLTWYFHDV